MNKPLFLIIFYSTVATCGAGQQEAKECSPRFAVAEIPTPVLNTPDFFSVFGGKDGKTLHRDDNGIIREVEFIAFPKTVFTIEDTIRKGNITIYKVATEEYPYASPKGYFIDSRFVTTADNTPPPRPKKLPSRRVITKNLLSAEGNRYLWGGNYQEGIPQMFLFYPPSHLLSQEIKEQWMLMGVDCSGLLYEATDGYTPRNTSSLVSFGKPVKIADLSPNQLIETLEPLDIVVWEGHLIIVLDNEYTIESRLDYDKEQEGSQGGVRIRKLREVVNETLQERIPVDNYQEKVGKGRQKFVVRRWYSSLHTN